MLRFLCRMKSFMNHSFLHYSKRRIIMDQKKQGFDTQKIEEKMKSVKHKIAVLSGKGGVGKSTVSANLALALVGEGYSVGLLDVDIHGPSIPKLLGVEDEKPLSSGNAIIPVEPLPGLKVMSMAFLVGDRDAPVIWRGPMKMGVIQQFLGDVEWGDLDFLIVDLPPGTGDEPLSIAQLISSDLGAVVVTTPQDVALVSVRKSMTFVKKIGMNPLGVVENMSGFICPHCGKSVDIFKKGGGKKAAEDFDVPFLGAVPLDPLVVEVGDSGKGMVSLKKDSETMKAFESVVEKLLNVIDEKKN